MKRFLISFLLILILIGNISAFAYTDVHSDDLKQAVSDLSDFGIINGYNDGTFKPDNYITRAEFSKVICLTGGFDIPSSYSRSFSDVAKNHWATDYIYAAKNIGIINGMNETTFAPEANITYLQAVKMIVAALGYSCEAEQRGGYPDGYMELGHELGITKGMAFSGNSNATRGYVARMIRNALDTDFYYLSNKNGVIYRGRALNTLYKLHYDAYLSGRKIRKESVKMEIVNPGPALQPTSPGGFDTIVYDKYGSAGYINGKTIIVSIFANDTTTSWDFSKDEHNSIAHDTLKKLGVATEWISQQVSSYGAKAEFIYDWRKNVDLVFGVNMNHDVVNQTSGYHDKAMKYIDKYINSSELLQKYGAQNIIYMFFYNTPYSNQVNPWSNPKRPSSAHKSEIINLLCRFDDKYITCEATYAHEILHCFGAVDLYYTGKGITQDYIDNLKKTNSNDIMYTVSEGNKIRQEFTELDAYYVGLVKSSSEVNNWGLCKSDYEILGY